MRPFRIRLDDLARLMPRPAAARPPESSTNLVEVLRFGANPGSLRMFQHVPAGLPANAPLVVALHGCTQDAAAYDAGTGWSALADAAGFALVLPQQTQGNNQNRCLNWFEPGDVARGQGEAGSIVSIVAHALAANRGDPRRVFITGLSAGGAMTAAMLASHPEVFAGGAIISGLPFGIAASVPDAFAAMAGQRHLPAGVLADGVRRAAPRAGPWPLVSIWHGDDDRVVAPANADQLAAQWAAVHGVDGARPRTETFQGWRRTRWAGPDGVTRVEEVRIAALGHAVPIDASPGQGPGLGRPGRHFNDVGLDSTRLIAASWGLIPQAVAPQRPLRRASGGAAGPEEIVRETLRAAGLGRA